MVYCRFPNGEIQACDAQPLEIMKKINRGIMPLNDYGQFCSNAYYMDHPFEPLFQAGGAHEMSVGQIVELGYHLHPPLVPTCDEHVGSSSSHPSHKGAPGAGSRKAQGCWSGARSVVFPQLEHATLPERPEECEFCDRDDLPTIAALKQHQDVMHNDRRQQQQLGEAIVAGLQRTGVVGGGSNVDAQAIAAAVATTLQMIGYGAQPRRPEPPPEGAEADVEEEEPTPASAPPKRGRPPLTEQQRENLARGRQALVMRRIPIEKLNA
jgi:hypothetical protein